MVILGERGLSGILKLMIDLVLLGGLGIFLSLPWSLRWYIDTMHALGRENYFFLLGFLYFTGFFCLIIVNEMRKIFKTLNRLNPFMMDNVKSLKRMAVSAFVIAAAYFVKIIFYNTFLTIVIAMIFVIGGLFALVLSEVFRQAVVVKEENDLTI